MLHFKHFKSIVASLLAACAVAVPVGKADAAVFVGTFDPSFGGNLANLGFRGQATFFVPDACLGTSGFVVNANLCSNGAMSMTAATVDLYRFDLNLLAPPPPTLASAIFAPPAASLVDVLLSYNSFTGQTSLLGVNTGEVGPQGVNVVDSGGPIYSGNIWLQFFEPQFSINFSSDVLAFAVAPGSQRGAYLFACDPAVRDGCSQIQSNPAQVTFVQIPEPATWGLVTLALAGSVFVRRRASRGR